MNHEIHEKHEKILYKEKCLEREQYRRQIPFESKKEHRIFYKHEPLAQIIRMAN